MNSRKTIIAIVLFLSVMGIAFFSIGRINVQARTKLVMMMIIALAIFVILRRSDLAGKIDQALFVPRDIDYSNCATARVDETRKKTLQAYANELWKDIESTPVTGHDCSLYTKVNALCDEELVYLAQYYKRELNGGQSLRDAIDTQWTILCDDEMASVMAHLSKVGEIS